MNFANLGYNVALNLTTIIFSRMHKFIATLSGNWYCWWCYDTFLINILEMSILSKWSYFEKSQLTYKQLFLCVKKLFQKLKIYIVFSLDIWFFISISDCFIENCGISVFNVKSTTPFFITCSTYLVIIIT